MVQTHPIIAGDQPGLWRCPYCAWQARVTPHGLVVIVSGEQGVLHPAGDLLHQGQPIEVELSPEVERFVRGL